MNGYDKDICTEVFDGAKRTLLSAKSSFDGKYFNESVNNSYYVVFGVIKSILALEEFDFSKSKIMILGYFNDKYISSGVFPKEFGARLGKIKYMHEMCNPENGYFATQREAEEQLKTAEGFLYWGKAYLENKD